MVFTFGVCMIGTSEAQKVAVVVEPVSTTTQLFACSGGSSLRASNTCVSLPPPLAEVSTLLLMALTVDATPDVSFPPMVAMPPVESSVKWNG